MNRARRKRRFHFPIVPVLGVALLAGAAWMFWPNLFPNSIPPATPAERVPLAAAGKPATSSPAEFTPPWGNDEKLESRAAAGPPPAVPVAVLADPAGSAPASDVRLASDESAAFDGDEAGDTSVAATTQKFTSTASSLPSATPAPAADSVGERVASAIRQYQSGERIEARHKLNAMLAAAPGAAEAAELRKHLALFAEETIFSRLRVPNDPLIAEHRVEPKETLIEIAARFDIPHQAILLVNPGLDPKKLRAGMDLKVPRGPFHLKISKSAFRLDLFLQDLYVRSFPVGLGGETDTPSGVWKIVDRQVDPTYYPPATATDKRVIPGKDPRNPLGSYYLKLEGIAGDAIGRKGFAVHGTNEPASIGKAESLGCIRMLNEDVEYLYKLVRSQKSLVTVSP